MENINDALEQLNENLDYFGNYEKCLKCIHAINYLMIHRPISSNLVGNGMTFTDLFNLKKEINQHINAMDDGFSTARLNY